MSMTGSRLQQAGTALLSAIAIAITCGSCSTSAEGQRANYCAMMPDSLGLYVGNAVTQMGYKIGEVAAITSSPSEVRVDFWVEADRRLPSDVRAVTRSMSILTDRALELVGNYTDGPRLHAGGCIPLDRSSTPKSLSEVIGSATNFLNTVNPDGSTNINGVVSGVAQALHTSGPGINRLLTTSAAVLDAPDQGVADIRTIIASLVQLTSSLRSVKDPMKQILIEANETTPDVVKALNGGTKIFDAVSYLGPLVADLEVELGDATQKTLDDLEVAIRKASAHSTLLASMLKPGPVIINWLINMINKKQFSIRYRPPLYRIATRVDGLLTCGQMNAAMPGSCADVAGKPYAVDVALLQYVLEQASHP